MLLEEMCESYRQSGDNTQIDIENICSSLSLNISNISTGIKVICCSFFYFISSLLQHFIEKHNFEN